jgi:hypothetical protein
MFDLDGQEREALEKDRPPISAFGGAIAHSAYYKGWMAARDYYRAALAAREEPPTHFEWPEHYEVGETQTTACEIPLDGRSHTSYRKEVSCVACLQTMLGAREDTERPDNKEARDEVG